MTDLNDIERRLNVTNFQDHPTNQMYRVYHFKMKEQANYFSELLEKEEIYFESDEEPSDETTLYLFGIHKKDVSKVTQLNYLALGKFRKPLIQNKGMRWFVVLLGIGALVLAIVSYFLKK